MSLPQSPSRAAPRHRQAPSVSCAPSRARSHLGTAEERREAPAPPRARPPPSVRQRPSRAAGGEEGPAWQQGRFPSRLPLRAENLREVETALRGGGSTPLPADEAVSVAVAGLEKAPHPLLLASAGGIAAAARGAAHLSCRHHAPSSGEGEGTTASSTRGSQSCRACKVRRLHKASAGAGSRGARSRCTPTHRAPPALRAPTEPGRVPAGGRGDAAPPKHRPRSGRHPAGAAGKVWRCLSVLPSFRRPLPYYQKSCWSVSKWVALRK